MIKLFFVNWLFYHYILFFVSCNNFHLKYILSDIDNANPVQFRLLLTWNIFSSYFQLMCVLRPTVCLMTTYCWNQHFKICTFYQTIIFDWGVWFIEFKAITDRKALTFMILVVFYIPYRFLFTLFPHYCLLLCVVDLFL